MSPKFKEYAKFWVSLAATVGVALLTVFTPDTLVGQIATVVVAVGGSVAVVLTKNADPKNP